MNEPLKVMLVGEGANELGDWIKAAPFRMARRTRRKDVPPVIGVLEALLCKVAPDGWEVVDAMPWSGLVKLKQKTDATGDAQNLARALLRAKEQRYDVVVFSRDRDGAKNRPRQVEIDAIVAETPSSAGAVKVVGAVAVETLEAWVLAAAGDRRCESHTDPGKELILNSCQFGRFDGPASCLGYGVRPPHRRAAPDPRQHQVVTFARREGCKGNGATWVGAERARRL